MSDWMYRLAQMLAMIYEAMREEIRSCTYLQIDETPVRYQDPGSGKCGQGYLWPYHAPGKAVFFEWHTGRASECLDQTLKGFKGIVQSDGYSAYGAYKKRHPCRMEGLPRNPIGRNFGRLLSNEHLRNLG